MIKIKDLIQEQSNLLEMHKEEFRKQLKTALVKDGGLQDGEPGPEVQRVLDRWMDDPRSLLDSDDIEFILDDETLF